MSVRQTILLIAVTILGATTYAVMQGNSERTIASEVVNNQELGVEIEQTSKTQTTTVGSEGAKAKLKSAKEAARKIKKNKPTINSEEELQVVVEEPADVERVWFFTQYEFDMLRQEQKNEFAEAISKSFIKKNKILTGLDELKTKETALDAFTDKDKWAKIEGKINSACKDSKNHVACEEVSDLRINVLMNYRSRK